MDRKRKETEEKENSQDQNKSSKTNTNQERRMETTKDNTKDSSLKNDKQKYQDGSKISPSGAEKTSIMNTKAQSHGHIQPDSPTRNISSQNREKHPIEDSNESDFNRKGALEIKVGLPFENESSKENINKGSNMAAHTHSSITDTSNGTTNTPIDHAIDSTSGKNSTNDGAHSKSPEYHHIQETKNIIIDFKGQTGVHMRPAAKEKNIIANAKEGRAVKGHPKTHPTIETSSRKEFEEISTTSTRKDETIQKVSSVRETFSKAHPKGKVLSTYQLPRMNIKAKGHHYESKEQITTSGTESHDNTKLDSTVSDASNEGYTKDKDHSAKPRNSPIVDTARKGNGKLENHLDKSIKETSHNVKEAHGMAHQGLSIEGISKNDHTKLDFYHEKPDPIKETATNEKVHRHTNIDFTTVSTSSNENGTKLGYDTSEKDLPLEVDNSKGEAHSKKSGDSLTESNSRKNIKEKDRQMDSSNHKTEVIPDKRLLKVIHETQKTASVEESSGNDLKENGREELQMHSSTAKASVRKAGPRTSQRHSSTKDISGESQSNQEVRHENPDTLSFSGRTNKANPKRKQKNAFKKRSKDIRDKANEVHSKKESVLSFHRDTSTEDTIVKDYPNLKENHKEFLNSVVQGNKENANSMKELSEGSSDGYTIENRDKAEQTLQDTSIEKPSIKISMTEGGTRDLRPKTLSEHTSSKDAPHDTTRAGVSNGSPSLQKNTKEDHREVKREHARGSKTPNQTKKGFGPLGIQKEESLDSRIKTNIIKMDTQSFQLTGDTSSVKQSNVEPQSPTSEDTSTSQKIHKDKGIEVAPYVDKQALSSKDDSSNTKLKHKGELTRTSKGIKYKGKLVEQCFLIDYCKLSSFK